MSARVVAGERSAGEVMGAIESDALPVFRQGLAVTVGWRTIGVPIADDPRRRSMVVQAYILIQTEVGKAAEVAPRSPRSRASPWPRTSPVPTT